MILTEPFGGVIPGARGAALAALLRTGEPLTGRRVHEVARGGHSLGAIQQGLNSWVRLGIVASRPAGRALLYSVVESHGAVPALRVLVDPWRMLQDAVDAAVDARVRAVMLFGSTATGRATADSDIDLAVIADDDWDGRFALQDRVRDVTGNACDVLVFTPDEFQAAATRGEPVVADIVRDSVVLVGEKPRLNVKAGR